MTKDSLPAAYFEALYASNADPWGFASSEYERAKYADTAEALGPRYRRGLEIGCSIGVLTAQLAQRCEELVAVDASDTALGTARERCAAYGNIAFARMVVPAAWPTGSFDLILLSEVLYYFAAKDLVRIGQRVTESLAPGGDLVLVHWTGATDYPQSGNAAVTAFVAAMPGDITLTRSADRGQYRLDTLRRRPPA